MGAFADLQKAIDDVAAQKAGLDAQYQEQRREIESQYQLSETPAERKRLQDLLDRLDAEREQATTQLREGYNQAREQVLQRVQSATGAGNQEVQQLASNFERAYAQIAAEEQASAQRYSRAGIPVNFGGAPDTGMRDALAQSAATAGAAATARNAITQEDIAWLADSLLGQREASIGEAGRTAMRVGGAATDAHNQRVQDRINQERILKAEALQNLTARIDDRRDSLLGRHGDLVTQLETLREQRRQHDAQMAQQAAARRAAASRSSGGGGGGGSSRALPTAAGSRVNEGALNDAVMAMRAANRAEAVSGVNMPPGYMGLPVNVGVRGGQGYLARGTQSAPSSGAGSSQLR